MVMKDKLVKNNRKGKRDNRKKIAIVASSVLLLGLVIAVPTYITSVRNNEKQGLALEESSEVIEESSSESLEEINTENNL